MSHRSDRRPYYRHERLSLLKYILLFRIPLNIILIDLSKHYTEEDQKTQWPKEKVQKEKQRSTKHTNKTKDRITRTPLKPGVSSGAPEG
jgi:hypothetical protein